MTRPPAHPLPLDDDALDLRGAALAPRRDVDPAAIVGEARRRRRTATGVVAVAAVAAVGLAAAVGLGTRDDRPDAGDRVALQPSTTDATPGGGQPADGDLPDCEDAAALPAPAAAVWLPCADGRSVAPVERAGTADLAGAAAALSSGPLEDERGRGWVDLVEGTVTAELREDRVLVDVAPDDADPTVALQLRAALLATVAAWTGLGEEAVVFTLDGSCGSWESATGTPCEAPAGGAPPAPTGCATAPELPACTPGEGEGD